MSNSKDFQVLTTGSSKTFLFHFFGCSVFCDSFPHLYSSAYLIFHALDLFKLYTNTPNYPDMSLNSLLYTSLLFCNTLWSLEVLSVICTSIYPLSHTLEVPAKHSYSLPFWFLYFKLFLIT